MSDTAVEVDSDTVIADLRGRLDRIGNSVALAGIATMLDAGISDKSALILLELFDVLLTTTEYEK